MFPLHISLTLGLILRENRETLIQFKFIVSEATLNYFRSKHKGRLHESGITYYIRHKQMVNRNRQNVINMD